MFTFLRRIRQTLLSENKFSKYLLYAIGEIVLVVIGILIALQINTWNESRKDRIEEQALYQTLINSLESDLDDVIDKIAIVESALEAQKLFMLNSYEAIEMTYDINQVEDYLYSLSESSRSFFPNYGLYNKIANNNQIDLIQSADLQMKIIELYEQYYKRYNDLDLNIEHQSLFSLYANYYSLIQDHATEYGRYEINFDMLKEHYDILQVECRKINPLTLLTLETMLSCKHEIESLLVDVRNEVE